MPRVKLDETTIKTAALPEGKTQEIYWDTKLPGLGLRVGAKTKTFIFQRDMSTGVGRVTRRVTLGRDDMGVSNARIAAKDQEHKMREGIDPTAQRRERVREQQRKVWELYTLRQARDHHLLNMKAKRCSPRSMNDITEWLDRHLAEWLDRPLADITPAMAIERHRDVTDKSGPYAANGLLRRFRACYNAAKRLHRELPDCPANAIVYNAQQRRREPVADLAAWYEKVQTINNPIRRDYQLFVMLTGLRATDAATVKFAEIDWKAGTLLRPNPKGGEKYAFTIPLSGYVLAMLAKRQMENQMIHGGTDWVFPSKNMAGEVTHMQVAREQRYKKDEKGKPRKVNFLQSPHRLRDTFISACVTEAKVDPITVKCLVNHRLPSGDVTTEYVRPSLEHMRAATEAVTAVLLGKMGVVVSVAEHRKGA